MNVWKQNITTLIKMVCKQKIYQNIEEKVFGIDKTKFLFLIKNKFCVVEFLSLLSEKIFI
jgi:hypothetical protein